MSELVEQKTQPLQMAAEPSTIMGLIERAARDESVDIEKMERLMQMHDRMCAKQAETAFNMAMNAVQARMRRISADAQNNQTRSSYATYGKLDAALRPIYTDEGISLSFDTEPAGDGLVGIVCYVSHIAGHTRAYRAAVPSDGKGAKGGDVMTKTHAFGSGASYGMRYLLKMIFNVAIGEDDDDGNGAAEAGPAEWASRIMTAADMKSLAEIRKKAVHAMSKNRQGYELVAKAAQARKAQIEQGADDDF